MLVYQRVSACGCGCGCGGIDPPWPRSPFGSPFGHEVPMQFVMALRQRFPRLGFGCWGANLEVEGRDGLYQCGCWVVDTVDG